MLVLDIVCKIFFIIIFYQENLRKQKEADTIKFADEDDEIPPEKSPSPEVGL